jgi:hypothetical protein
VRNSRPFGKEKGRLRKIPLMFRQRGYPAHNAEMFRIYEMEEENFNKEWLKRD